MAIKSVDPMDVGSSWTFTRRDFEEELGTSVNDANWAYAVTELIGFIKDVLAEEVSSMIEDDEDDVEDDISFDDDIDFDIND